MDNSADCETDIDELEEGEIRDDDELPVPSIEAQTKTRLQMEQQAYETIPYIPSSEYYDETNYRPRNDGKFQYNWTKRQSERLTGDERPIRKKRKFNKRCDNGSRNYQHYFGTVQHNVRQWYTNQGFKNNDIQQRFIPITENNYVPKIPSLLSMKIPTPPGLKKANYDESVTIPYVSRKNPTAEAAYDIDETIKNSSLQNAKKRKCSEDGESYDGNSVDKTRKLTNEYSDDNPLFDESNKINEFEDFVSNGEHGTTTNKPVYMPIKGTFRLPRYYHPLPRDIRTHTHMPRRGPTEMCPGHVREYTPDSAGKYGLEHAYKYASNYTGKYVAEYTTDGCASKCNHGPQISAGLRV